MKTQEILNEAVSFTNDEFNQMEEALIYWIDKGGLSQDPFYGENQDELRVYKKFAEEALVLVRQKETNFTPDQSEQIHQAMDGWANEGIDDDDFYADDPESKSLALALSQTVLSKLNKKWRREQVATKRRKGARYV